MFLIMDMTVKMMGRGDAVAGAGADGGNRRQ